MCHSYCLDCFRQLVTTALYNEAQFPPKCCLNDVPSKTVLKYVPRDVARRYQAKADEFATPLADRYYCPTVDCGAFVPPAQIAPGARIAHCRAGHETCTQCREPAHGTGRRRAPCPELTAAQQRDRQLADDLATEEGWRRCHQCGVLIEHREACQHMTCRCGAEFCYVCGAVWKTCHCSIADLHRRKGAAAARRTAREAREQQERELAEAADRELADLRADLARVARFERREARRLEAVRAAQRARLHRLRAQREAALRDDVAAKYARLHLLLRALGAAQFGAARAARHAARAALRAAHASDRAALAARHEEERVAADAVAATAVRDAERFWLHDYAARLALERQLEDEYRALLGVDEIDEIDKIDKMDKKGKGKEVCGTSPRAPAAAAKALRAFQRANDARLDDYLAWRARELARARFVAEDDCAVAGELREAARRRLARQQRAARRDLETVQAAERTWCRAVAAERARLLAEAEAVEQSLGLAASPSEADASLLMLLELEESGVLGATGDSATEAASQLAAQSRSPGSTRPDVDMDHLYAMMLADAAGDEDEFDVPVVDADNLDEDSVVGDDDTDTDSASFHSVAADVGSGRMWPGATASGGAVGRAF